MAWVAPNPVISSGTGLAAAVGVVGAELVLTAGRLGEDGAAPLPPPAHPPMDATTRTAMA